MPPKKRKVVRGKGIISGLKKAAKVVHHVAKAVGSKTGQQVIGNVARHYGYDPEAAKAKVNKVVNTANIGARYVSGDGKKHRKVVRGGSLIKPNMRNSGFAIA